MTAPMTGRARAGIVGVLALLGLASGADARLTTPAAAPRAWLVYAQGATAAITGWLNGAAPPAPAFRAALLADAPATDPRSATVELSVWVDRAGNLSRVAHTPFADKQAERDLEALLIGKPLGAPPKRMRQPMRLTVTVAPAPPPDPAAASLL